ncbi:SPOR domain-containing protein [Hyalangium minutum]|uniref:Translation initiation factor 2 n=1 Tax=Hyalangium minutum TaxID=394096 RepID=A0A085WRS1_9BACT|nr:SPOR domain-containing protein [Hyalangium minutum]KFE70384.1 Translation initiation factor 2 [Hyalangium minutum]
MRDAHRMKEKFDVSLDNRQIVSLLIAGIVVMGAVFVLGVVVGKKLAGNAEASAAPDLLSALDANAQVLQEAQQEPPLTFQDELTRKSSAAAAPEPKPAAKPPAAKPTPAPAAAAAPAPATKPAPAAAAEKPAEKPVEKPETAYSAADEELAALAAAKRPQAAAEKPAPAATPAPKPASTTASAPVAAPKPTAGAVAEETVPTRTTTPAGGGLKEAIARATQRPTETAPGGAFTLQLSAFQTREEADRFAGRLRDRGYAPYIVTAEVPNKGTWYRVRMGSFPSKDAATRYLTDFKRETQLDAFVAGTN